MISDDLVFVEERKTHRSVVGMPGRYALGNWGAAQRERREFECAIRSMSPKAITIEGPVTGALGQSVVATFDQLGTFEGPIVQILKRAFVMRIVATHEERAKVAGKITWITSGGREARRAERMVPANPHSIVSLPDDRTLPCVVVDYSITGAALYADETPEYGTVVRIGKVSGSVVRHFGGGFAVTFSSPQNPDLIEGLVTQPPPE